MILKWFKNVSRSSIIFSLRGFFLLSVILVMSLSSCASSLTNRAGTSSKKLKPYLVANPNEKYIPFDVTLTARINNAIITEAGLDTIVLLWIERRPDGNIYKAREEFSYTPDAPETDQFFYHNTPIDMSGRYNYYLILFPDDSAHRMVSNTVNVFARAQLYN